MKREEIGYLCMRDHFCFYADEEEDGACGSKSIAKVYVEWDPALFDDEDTGIVEATIARAEESLAEKYAAWRAS